MILVAGPYRSGTGDDPARIAANHDAIRQACLELFRAGHLPVNGEDLALPLAELAGSRAVGDAAFDDVFIRWAAAWWRGWTACCGYPARRRDRMRWSIW